MAEMIAMRKIPFVLSGFAAHLASHLWRSFANHSYGYACSNDRPNCIASYTTQPNPSCNMRVKAGDVERAKSVMESHMRAAHTGYIAKDIEESAESVASRLAKAG